MNASRRAEPHETTVARRRAYGLALATVALGACAPASEARLLDVRELTPDRVEPGHRLQVRGGGFPPGRDARLRLEGRMHRPGEAPREASVDLDGRAVSNEQLEARFTERALAALGGRGTFRGHLTVSFDAAHEGSVVGRSPRIALDVAPPSTDRLDQALTRRRRASELVHRLGLSLGEEDPDVAGLPVEDVAEGSAAAHAGLVTGDRCISMEGVRLHALSDFVPPPGTEIARLEVGRSGEAASFELRVPVQSSADGISPAALRAGQAALAWVLLVFLVLAPSAAVLDWLGRRGALPLSRGSPVAVARGLRRHGPTALRLLLGAAFLAALITLDRASLLHVPLAAVVVGTLAARAAAAHLGAPAGGRRWTRLWALAGALGASVLAAVAVSALGAAAGTTDLGALHDQQGAMPWEWAALRTPAGPVLAGLVLAAGAFAPRGRTPAERIAAAAEEIAALVLAAVLAAVLLGGWVVAEDAGPAVRFGAASLFVVKGLACWALMRRSARARAPSRWLAGAVAALAAALLAAAWIAWEPPFAVETALAEVATAVAAAVALVLLHHRAAGVADAPPSPAHPFL